MIEVSAATRAVLGRNFVYHVRAQSWIGGDLLHDDVPISAGVEEGDRTSNVPTRVTLTVPEVKRGFDWTPIDDYHPLAANGQQLRIQVGVDSPEGIEWIDRGVFVILSSKRDGRGGISVEAADLLYLVSEARYASPYQPSGTLKSTLRGLVEPAVTVVYDAALTDRSVPTDVNYDGTRMDAMNELLDAWPAEAAVTPDGYLMVSVPTTPTTADLVITPRVVKALGDSSRADGFNAVVAKGRTTDGADIQGTAYVEYGPRSFGGPFNPLAVTFEYFSPLLTTLAQCQAAAKTVRDRKLRTTGKAYEVEMIPDPTLRLGDAVDLGGELCTIEKLRLPYTPESMSLTVRTLA